MTEAVKETLCTRRRGVGGAGMIELQPITFKEAKAYINEHHRHHIAPHGWKFGIAVNDGEKVVGVITVGRPIARHYDDGWTFEVTRCCTDGTKNAASMLYGAAWRASKAMGAKRLITYTLQEEPGTSLRAAGWREVGKAGGGTWNRPNTGRVRTDKHPTGVKTLWEAVIPCNSPCAGMGRFVSIPNH